MARIFTVLLVLLLAALGVGVLLWYLAYGTDARFSGEARVPGLRAPVTIAYTDADVPIIEAQSETDLYTGLGYAHALQSAWPMVLWRQAATGSLSAWFQDSTALTLDRHALALGFGAFARATYEDLPDDDRAVLEAYARGVNRAFDRARLNEGDEFVLFDVRAEPWRPWDALAIERLVAYLAIPPSALPDSTAPAAYRASPPLRRFVVADSVFRSTLYLGGLEHALAFTLRDSTGTSLVQRQVYGSSALPLFREVVLRQGGHNTLVASIPGTLMVPGRLRGDRLEHLPERHSRPRPRSGLPRSRAFVCACRHTRRQRVPRNDLSRREHAAPLRPGRPSHRPAVSTDRAGLDGTRRRHPARPPSARIVAGPVGRTPAEHRSGRLARTASRRDAHVHSVSRSRPPRRERRGPRARKPGRHSDWTA